ncbi:hypothetical protein PHYBLDRAFT_64220 [Phycomyces blakesleeanus NRRL 1555(-)]|uniref:Uncharacterized protein n=1 Tax=Phycomyces blakesleeanus (strain ATCC 8743b / DSM 1359 / FGSC 10004 / NBRC 33097 / NRRL 1555) TaxID=763407 RepID=A0A167N864_PHYB8|nr:hypothetical protein PHYBLDRAFT_64220 [Phycomyces blakesleeanus NRRL 1555(-)]OAD75294.1 hypothetical protein PHYBLDRAFT_64220 [Phycomyces blakesleeanus NRRL 1555(-)]|eukprot:XP_018293334.1 hypothetical protein PHYBLDRAFT_64220 [Phycomyces blakesleeanus NRRL 1555(-)]
MNKYPGYPDIIDAFGLPRLYGFRSIEIVIGNNSAIGIKTGNIILDLVQNKQIYLKKIKVAAKWLTYEDFYADCSITEKGKHVGTRSDIELSEPLRNRIIRDSFEVKSKVVHFADVTKLVVLVISTATMS